MSHGKPNSPADSSDAHAAIPNKHQSPPAALSETDRAVYEWQMWVPEFGEHGQQLLRDASVLVSRVGGLGSAVAYQLAAAGVGKLILAHAGNIRPSDLNRQLLMTHARLGTPRVESARDRLLDLNPRLEIVTCSENVNDSNAAELVASADVIIDCAPLFTERFAMNRECVRQRKPMIESAVYELEGNVTTFIPGQTPCLQCLFPGQPPVWQRQFPIFGAVSGTTGSLAAMEAIKVLTGLGQPLLNRMLTFDLRDMTFRTRNLQRDSSCTICSHLP